MTKISTRMFLSHLFVSGEIQFLSENHHTHTYWRLLHIRKLILLLNVLIHGNEECMMKSIT